MDSLTGSQWLLLIVAGAAAGIINAAVGSGSLISYPALLSVGFPPVVANATNSFGMAAGNVSATWSYRRFLEGRKPELIRWCTATAIGAAVGALLVVVLPSSVFAALVPWLILSAVVVIAISPLITKKLRNRQTHGAITPAVGLVGVYGGYFGAGQGIAYLAALGSLEGGDIQRTNAVKNALATAANTTGAVVFLISGQVRIVPAIVMGLAALLGGLVGGGAAKRLPPWSLRAVIIVVGLYAVYVSFKAIL